MVDIGLYKAINKSKVISGELVGKQDGVITIVLPDGSNYEINEDSVSSVKLAVIF